MVRLMRAVELPNIVPAGRHFRQETTRFDVTRRGLDCCCLISKSHLDISKF